MLLPVTPNACPTCGGTSNDRLVQGPCRACLLRTTLGLGDPAAVPADLDTLFGNLDEESTAPGGGIQIEGFEILSEIARGGMGVVFRARQRRLNRIVALKMIRHGPLAVAEDLARFRREAEVVAQLQHPHIVSIYEVGEHDGEPWFAMAFVDGPSLAAEARKNPLPPVRAARLMLPVCDAIQHAHDRGVLHRDLKPSNILLDALDRPYVTDFGLARSTKQDSSLTGTAGIIGSPSYMAPEQASGMSHQADARADVYSVGAVLYELLTGRPPFQAESAIRTLQLVLNAEPVAPRRLNPTLPLDLETICLKCLAKTPAHRYPSVRALGADLAAFLEHKPIQARPTSMVEWTVRWYRRNPVLASLAISLGWALVIGSIGVVWQWRRAEHNASRELQQRHLAEESERQRSEQLYESLLAQAHAQALGIEAGSRAAGLTALRRAVELQGPNVALRSEAITTLAKTDFRLDQQWHEHFVGEVEPAATFNADVTQWISVAPDPGDVRHSLLSLRSVATGRSNLWTTQIDLSPNLAVGPFSADGHWLIVYDSEWRLLQADTGKQIQHWTNEYSNEERMRGFTGDLTEIALVKISAPTLVRFELTTGVRHETRLRAEPASIVFRPGTREAYYSSYELKSPDQLSVQCVNLDNGHETQFPLAAQPTLLVWSSDGRWLAAHAEDLQIHLWDFSGAPHEVGKLGPCAGWRTAAAFSGDARIFASCGTEGVINVWEVSSRQLLAQRDGAYGSSLRLQPPWLGINNRIEGALERHQLRIDDVCRVLAEPTTSPGPGPSDAVFSSDTSLLISSAPDGLRLWDWRAGTEVGFVPGDRTWDIQRFDHELLLRGPGFYQRYQYIESPDRIEVQALERYPAPFHTRWCVPPGFLLVEASDSGLIELTRQTGPIHRLEPPEPLISMKANATGQRLLGLAATSLTLWDLIEEKQLYHWSTEPLTAVTWSRRGEAFFTAGWKSTCAWDPGTGERLWRNSDCRVRTEECVIVVSPDERLVALTTGASEVTLLSRSSGDTLARFTHPRPQPTMSVAFSPDSCLLVVLNINHFTQIWDLRKLRAQLAELGLDWPGPPIIAAEPPKVRPVLIRPRN